MHRLAWAFLASVLAAFTLAGCDGPTSTSVLVVTATPAASQTATTTVTAPPATATATPSSSSHPTPTNTPKSNPPTPTQQPVPTAPLVTTPSDPQSLEDCFTNAFQVCSNATIDVTFFEGTFATGTTTTDDAMRVGPGCTGALIKQHIHKVAANGGPATDSSSTFTCAALVPSGSKYSLRECGTNNELPWIFFP
jgi:hypothetical protein